MSNTVFKRNFLCNLDFFRQIDFLQSFVTSHGKKSFAQFFVKLTNFSANWQFSPQFDEKLWFSYNLAKMFFNFTEKRVQMLLSHGIVQSFLAKLFVPWEKKLCTNRKIPSNWRIFRQIGSFLVNLTKNYGFSFNLAKMFFNFTGKLAKLFVPWEKNLCKLQIFVEFI